MALDNHLADPSRTRLEESLRELLARIGLRLVNASEVSSTRARVRVLVQPYPDAVIVSVYEAPGAFRQYRVESATDEILVETLAHIILGAVEPWAVADHAAEAEPEQPRAAEVPPQIVPPANPPPNIVSADTALSGRSPRGDMGWAWAVGAYGHPMLQGSEGVTAAFAAGAVGTLRARGRPSVAIEGTYWIPETASTGSIHAQLSRFGARFRTRVEPLGTDQLAAQIGLECGVDYLQLTPRSSAALPSSLSPTTRLQPMVGGTIGGRWRLTEVLDLIASVGLDIELSPRRWVIASGAERDTLFETPRRLPRGTLGLEWTLSSTHWAQAARSE